ncbi:hypothetical protein BpHYR1_000413 [Brachionus plicatilis]|uniref:Uncharacterized protein n=1 Tax=Brachionus plicatilis TaxID=10195 RepID=A0A3M7QV60_BRAPC|nr:hypothetical protein BpHYR1_000413 [Brachionus plicatilis]
MSLKSSNYVKNYNQTVIRGFKLPNLKINFDYLDMIDNHFNFVFLIKTKFNFELISNNNISYYFDKRLLIGQILGDPSFFRRDDLIKLSDKLVRYTFVMERKLSTQKISRKLQNFNSSK